MALTDEAIGKIKEMIISGRVRPGEKPPREADLAAELASVGWGSFSFCSRLTGREHASQHRQQRPRGAQAEPVAQHPGHQGRHRDVQRSDAVELCSGP